MRGIRVHAATLLAVAAALFPHGGARADACLNLPSPGWPRPGDQQFFSLSSGPSDVMILLDNSGSMADLPQCANGWGSGTCRWPTWTITATSPSGSMTKVTEGYCSLPGTPWYGWLDAFAPNLASATAPHDNGNPSGYITDAPPWGQGCVGDACLFDSSAWYHYGDWGDSSANRTLDPCRPRGGNAFDGSLYTDYSGGTAATLTADATACNTCLTNKGYYLYRVRYKQQNGSWAFTTPQAVFSGRWLNLNPPKYVAARKVVKDLVTINPAQRSPLDSVRFGLTIFAPNSSSAETYASSMRAADGGRLVVPFGPNCSALSNPGGYSIDDFRASRQAIVDAVNSVTLVPPTSEWTPLAESLFNIGQYFSNTGTTNVYQSLFGASWLKTGPDSTAAGRASNFNENAQGTAQATWTAGNKSVCSPCSENSVVVVTDGMPTKDNNLPVSPAPASHAAFTGDFRAWADPQYVLPTRCGGAAAPYTCPISSSASSRSALPLVAKFLNTTNLRGDYASMKNVRVYTISFGVQDPNALHVLQQTADLGGGTFSNTSSATQLSAALYTAVSATVGRSTSFSANRASSLETARSPALGEAYIPRFKPNDSVAWEGHLYRGNLFSEFARGCDATRTNADQTLVACGAKMVNPNLNGDVDASGFAMCNGVFIVDADCDPIYEDQTDSTLLGVFLKGVFNATGGVAMRTTGGAAAANLTWDAGKVMDDPAAWTKGPDPALGLPYRSAEAADAGSVKHRLIYTYVNGARIEFVPANASTLYPYMNLSPAYCTRLYTALGLSPIPATWTASDFAYCAEQVIWFVRGFDVTDIDDDRCAGPANAPAPGAGRPISSRPNLAKGWDPAAPSKGCTDVTRGEQRERRNDDQLHNTQKDKRTMAKLGDLFHSSPAVVKPPISVEICDRGTAEPQCVGTIHGMKTATQTVSTPLTQYNDGTGTLVDAYSSYRLQQLAAGRRQVVLVGGNDGMLHAFDAGRPDTTLPTLFDGSYVMTDGTGAEVWAFVPPDLLPRLKDALFQHTYFVDGSAMVRDVWVDLNKNGTKERDEFRTVAIFGERHGGYAYTALDVTNPLDPQFLWTFPPENTVDRRLAGESWNDFDGRPPPMGPVRLKLASGAPDPAARGWEERWIVMLGGGYDPALLRGRIAWMLDVWTGKILWRWSDTEMRAVAPGARVMPIPAAIAMVDIGKTGEGGGGVIDSDGFFDTATWGDLGGTLYVARFYEPGERDPVSGLVTNWPVARAFEQGRRIDDRYDPAVKSPFFKMTGNQLDETTQHLYTYVGSGNNTRLLEQGRSCDTDNLTSCLRAGCSTDTRIQESYGAGNCAIDIRRQASSTAVTDTLVETSCAEPLAACSAFTSTVDVSYTCPTSPGPVASAGSAVCTHDAVLGASYCTTETPVPSAVTNFPSVCVHERFFGIWSYGGQSHRRIESASLTSAATAGVSPAVFDAQRPTDVTYAASCLAFQGNQCTLSDVSGTGASSRWSPGWQYQYTRCDEKTATAGIPDRAGCVSWNSFSPVGTGGGGPVDPCTGSAGNPSAFGYRADAITGEATAICGFVDSSGAVARFKERTTFAPPLEAQARTTVNAKGEISYDSLQWGTGEQTQNTSLSKRKSLVETIYWMDATRDLHRCRHVDAASCD